MELKKGDIQTIHKNLPKLFFELLKSILSKKIKNKYEILEICRSWFCKKEINKLLCAISQKISFEWLDQKYQESEIEKKVFKKIEK